LLKRAESFQSNVHGKSHAGFLANAARDSFDARYCLSYTELELKGFPSGPVPFVVTVLVFPS